MFPPQMASHIAAPKAPAPHAPGGVAEVLRALAMRQHGVVPRGPAARPGGAPFPLTARGNPVSPYGHEPPAPPVREQPQRPLNMGG